MRRPLVEAAVIDLHNGNIILLCRLSQRVRLVPARLHRPARIQHLDPRQWRVGLSTVEESALHHPGTSLQFLNISIIDGSLLTDISAQHFELTNESSLATAQADVVAEIAPEVARLLARVEAYLAKLERREQALVARAELQAGRLSQGRPSTAGAKAGLRGRIGHNPAGRSKAGGKEERYLVLRGKKERLGYAVERLTLQAQQRERQLRQSMAAQ